MLLEMDQFQINTIDSFKFTLQNITNIKTVAFTGGVKGTIFSNIIKFSKNVGTLFRYSFSWCSLTSLRKMVLFKSTIEQDLPVRLLL